MANKKKFYAVAKGRKPGIYDSWPLAKAQVDGFPGARYKGFAQREEAEAWRQAGLAGAGLPAAGSGDRLPSAGSGGRPARSSSAAAASRSTAPSAPPAPVEAAAGEIVVYTDGGAQGNPGPGGYGVVVLAGGRRRELSGGFRLTTNNRMELLACIVALRLLSQSDQWDQSDQSDRPDKSQPPDQPGADQPVRLYSDSSYVVNGINKGWARNWRRRGWRKSDGEPALNPDLWQELLALSEALTVEFNWVRGHAGNPLNERCDQLAVAAARQADLPSDREYEKLVG